MSRRSLLALRSTGLAALLGATALAACNAITGLDGEYRLAPPTDAANGGPNDDAGNDGATNEVDGATSTGEADGGPTEDSGTDAGQDSAVDLDAGSDASVQTDAGFCTGADVVFCTDFEDASSNAGSTPAFGVKGARVEYLNAGSGSVSLGPKAGTDGSKGLVVKVANDGAAGKRALLRIGLGTAIGKSAYEASFDMLFASAFASLPDFAKLTALSGANLDTAFGLRVGAAGSSAEVYVQYGGKSDLTQLSPARDAWYRVTLRAKFLNDSFVADSVHLAADGHEIFNRPGPADSPIVSKGNALELVLGVFDANPGVLEVHFDNVKVTATP